MQRLPEPAQATLMSFAVLVTMAAIGWPAPDLPPRPCDPVRFGLLISEDGDGAAVSESVRRGADMAIADANAAGGYQDCPFELVVRTDDGPWGTGSRSVTELVYEERVLAVLGGLDGRGAHLVEQVVTKAQVVLVSPWATEVTLAQARVPWFFRMAPDDDRQAAALVTTITGREIRRVAVMADETYDGGSARDAFLSQTIGSSLEAVAAEPDAISHVGGIVLFGAPTHVVSFLRRPEVRLAGLPIFGGLTLTLPAVTSAAAEPDAPELTVVRPGHWGSVHGQDFSVKYAARHGGAPSAPAAYGYDGVRVLVAAVRRGGRNRAAIRDAVAATIDPSGVTGPIRFDAQGNRDAPVATTRMAAAPVLRQDGR